MEPRAPHPREPDRTRYAWLSIGAAFSTLGLKLLAWRLTGSVALLSDALESIVNVVAALVALWVLRVAASPPDAEHEYGHHKAEYFSSGLEGALIIAAAVGIVVSAVPKLIHPEPLESVGVGLALSMAAAGINLATGRLLIVRGRTLKSIALEADGHHLMTDVWTSGGVLVGIVIVKLTKLAWVDPLIAIAVALQIVWTGVRLLRRSGTALLDASVSAEERRAIEAVLDGYKAEGASWHALRTRQAGVRRFVSLHVLVPGDWSVQRGHDLLERLERDVRALAPETQVTTHLEPLEDERSHGDSND
ncbi:MAG: cation diffusion facilitator family transporter [Polyangiaceae bacterium]